METLTKESLNLGDSDLVRVDAPNRSTRSGGDESEDKRAHILLSSTILQESTKIWVF